MKCHCLQFTAIVLFGLLVTGCAHTSKGAVSFQSETDPASILEQQDISDQRLNDKAVEEGNSGIPPDEKIPPSDAKDDTFNDDEYFEEENETVTIADPLETWNRGVFVFNDKFYFWVMKPVTRAYAYVIPEDVRVIFKNFYQNMTTPIRLVNNLLQLKMKAAGTEMLRFFINTTAGVFGFADVAKTDFDLQIQDEDFGQTLGRYGLGHGVYIVWPFIGPSSLRDTVGLAGDLALHPLWGWGYAPKDISFETSMTLTAHDYMNDISFRLGDYEALKEAAIDPYIMFRNAYIQNRKAKVEK